MFNDGFNEGFNEDKDIWVGRQYGPYKIIESLGRGTVSNVYRAQTSHEEQVALKVLTPFAEAQAEVRSLFEQEYELMGRMDHPNVLKVHGAGVIAGTHYMEMELVEGKTLWDLMEDRSSPSISTHINSIQQTCIALDHVHERRVVHRDIKPSNILLDKDRTVLFDFGLAFDLGGPPAPAGRIYGSPLFISPEQALTKEVTNRTDIYGLGATLYTLVVGTTPFFGSRSDLLNAHVNEPPPDPRKSGISDELTEVILRSMAKNPADRFASGADFAAALAMLDLDNAKILPKKGLLRRLAGSH